jgi:hypothetical protein
VNVRIYDEGIYFDHTELKTKSTGITKIDFGSSLGTSGNVNVIRSQMPPTPEELSDFGRTFSHGTAVASLIAGEPNNGLCGVGVAPRVTLGHGRFTLTNPNYLGGKPVLFDISVNPYASTVAGCVPSNGGTSGRRQRRRHLEDDEQQQGEDDLQRQVNALPHQGRPRLSPRGSGSASASAGLTIEDEEVEEGERYRRDHHQQQQRQHQRRRLKGSSKSDDGKDCPFTWPGSSTYPCTVPECDFSNVDGTPSSINDICRTAIISHCRFHAIRDFDACSSLSEFLVFDECKFDTYKSSRLDGSSFGLERTVTETIPSGRVRGRNGLVRFFVLFCFALIH